MCSLRWAMKPHGPARMHFGNILRSNSLNADSSKRAKKVSLTPEICKHSGDYVLIWSPNTPVKN